MGEIEDIVRNAITGAVTTMHKASGGVLGEGEFAEEEEGISKNIRVGGYTRRTKSGKIIHVSGYTRVGVAGMLDDTLERYAADPNVKDINEVSAGSAKALDENVPFSAEAARMTNPEYRSRVRANAPKGGKVTNESTNPDLQPLDGEVQGDGYSTQPFELLDPSDAVKDPADLDYEIDDQAIAQAVKDIGEKTGIVGIDDGDGQSVVVWAADGKIYRVSGGNGDAPKQQTESLTAKDQANIDTIRDAVGPIIRDAQDNEVPAEIGYLANELDDLLASITEKSPTLAESDKARVKEMFDEVQEYMTPDDGETRRAMRDLFGK